jgi:superfamily I DNA/RNA helicase
MDLLQDRQIAESVIRDIRYVLVDENQDTNYIQEQLLIKMTERSGNLCVVGDEDQSLYRFRGATVRNILEFPLRFPNCRVVRLTTNYRSHENREFLRFHLFNSFLRLLLASGINEYEDPDQPFPKGHAQVMTIHQAKGLEFPVVIVGSLDKQLATAKKVDQDLQPFYHRAPFEPPSRITLFDRMRLHYVAFSRPEKLLILTSHAQPKPHFAAIWQGLPQWPYVQKPLLAAQTFALKDRIPVKRSYSFTGDLKIYETCPRQYQFFREYDFTPSRSALIFFGLLVHQTIEESTAAF